MSKIEKLKIKKYEKMEKVFSLIVDKLNEIIDKDNNNNNDD